MDKIKWKGKYIFLFLIVDRLQPVSRDLKRKLDKVVAGIDSEEG